MAAAHFYGLAYLRGVRSLGLLSRFGTVPIVRNNTDAYVFSYKILETHCTVLYPYFY